MDIKQKKGGASEEADPLIGSLVKAKQFVSRNSTLLLVCGVAVVIVVGGAFIYNNMRESSIRKAQEIFGVGILDYQAEKLDAALVSFSEVANNFRHTPLGTMSAFMMGSIHLQQGSADQAITWFEAAVGGTESGFVRGQALEGLATAYEEKGDAASAVKYLERALRDRNVSHRHSAIRWKLALLSKDNANAASVYCKDLIADTLAQQYHQKAENLLAALNVAK